MSETRSLYAVSGQSNGLSAHSLLPYHSVLYSPPTVHDIQTLMRTMQLSSAQIAKLVGVQSRTVRKWTAPADTDNHSDIPYAPWRLLLILAQLVDPTIA